MRNDEYSLTSEAKCVFIILNYLSCLVLWGNTRYVQCLVPPVLHIYGLSQRKRCCVCCYFSFHVPIRAVSGGWKKRDMFSIWTIGNEREMTGMESGQFHDYWTFYVVMNSKQGWVACESGWSLGVGVVFGFVLLGTSSERKEKAHNTHNKKKHHFHCCCFCSLTEMKSVEERQEKKCLASKHRVSQKERHG